MNKKKRYFSQRNGSANADGYNFQGLRQLFLSYYFWAKKNKYFVEALGTSSQQGYIDSVDELLVEEIGKGNLWLVDKPWIHGLDDLFDIIEFLYEHISIPQDSKEEMIKGLFGLQPAQIYSNFDKKTAKKDYRTKVNSLLDGYIEKYELTASGFIEIKIDNGHKDLVYKGVFTADSTLNDRILKAVKDYKRSRGDLDAMHDAVRTLADVFESLKKSGKLRLDSKDENDLFNIANNFAIRHADPKQKTNYDRGIWLEWMFFYYLATANAVLKLMESKNDRR